MCLKETEDKLLTLINNVIVESNLKVYRKPYGFQYKANLRRLKREKEANKLKKLTKKESSKTT